MKSILIKDKLYRKKFFVLEKKKKRLKFLLIQNNLNNLLTIYYKFKLHKLNKGSITKIKNRCSITNRGRGNLSQFRVSRIKLRELLSLGLIPGYKQAIW